MAIVARTYPLVIGVDTHARTHTFAVLAAATGQLVASETFPTSRAGLVRATIFAGYSAWKPGSSAAAE